MKAGFLSYNTVTVFGTVLKTFKLKVREKYLHCQCQSTSDLTVVKTVMLWSHQRAGAAARRQRAKGYAGRLRMYPQV